MTELAAPFSAPPEAVRKRPDTEASPRTPVLITEQQVLFATAAALPLQPARTGWRWAHAVRDKLAAAFVSADTESRPKRRHYPPRKDFLEDSRMAREMLRL